MENGQLPLLEELGAPYWNWNIRDATCYLSPAFKKWLGYEGRELPDTIECLKNLIFPDDTVTFFEKLDHYVADNGRLSFFMAVRYLHLGGNVLGGAATVSVTERCGDGMPTV